MSKCKSLQLSFLEDIEFFKNKVFFKLRAILICSIIISVICIWDFLHLFSLFFTFPHEFHFHIYYRQKENTLLIYIYLIFLNNIAVLKRKKSFFSVDLLTLKFCFREPLWIFFSFSIIFCCCLLIFLQLNFVFII